MSETTKGKTITPKFVVDPTQSSNRVYSNYVNVNHTGLDFTLSFLDIAPPNPEQVKMAEQGKEIPAPLQCAVVVPNELVPSLIRALQEQYDKYKKTSDGKSETRGN